MAPAMLFERPKAKDKPLPNEDTASYSARWTDRRCDRRGRVNDRNSEPSVSDSAPMDEDKENYHALRGPCTAAFAIAIVPPLKNLQLQQKGASAGGTARHGAMRDMRYWTMVVMVMFWVCGQT